MTSSVTRQLEDNVISKEMENNDAHIPIYVGEEWPRPLSEIARPADNNAELFSLDTDTGKPREGAIPLERTRSAQKQVLQTVKEPVEHQIRKVYALATERVEEVSDQEYKNYLRDNLEGWYTGYTRRMDMSLTLCVLGTETDDSTERVLV